MSQVKGVIDTQYELFVPEGGSQNRDTMIALGIAHLVFRDIELPDQRGSRAAHIEFSKCAWESDGSSKDEELKLQVDALLREDPEMFQRLLQARDWES